MGQINQKPFSQRQLRVGELVKQNLGELFIRNEAKIPNMNSKFITVTEVRMTPDLKTARIYVIPLGGSEITETVKILTEYSQKRKILSPT
jgi:ribosome-binding factor A